MNLTIFLRGKEFYIEVFFPLLRFTFLCSCLYDCRCDYKTSRIPCKELNLRMTIVCQVRRLLVRLQMVNALREIAHDIEPSNLPTRHSKKDGEGQTECCDQFSHGSEYRGL